MSPAMTSPQNVSIKIPRNPPSMSGIPILLETYDDKVPNPNRDQGESIPRSTPTFDL